MRIAHIIMVHKNAAQVERLVRQLHHEDADIYVHIDKKADAREFAGLFKEEPACFPLTRNTCNWGGFSFLKAVVSSVREVIGRERRYDFVNLLSGQDYPLVSASALHQFFSSRIGTSFLSFDERALSEGDWLDQAKARYERYHFTDWKFRGAHLMQKIVNVITPRRRFPGNMRIYGGTNACWWTLSNECAAFLVDRFFSDRRLLQFLKLTWGSDEFVIPTLVMNSPYAQKTENNNYRYIDWSEGKAHPKILTSADYEYLASSSMLFARKFDPGTDANVLDRIDAKIAGQNIHGQ